ncbi:TetR family transcriptional regulator [Nonomuraea sp. NPDC052116]|uniref:TetR/AcrR family transcriptional regulator n=1 Tax=Nonomuraea sp. NPDC052116 TaxID=3155665 RepID=UPI003415B3BB
MVTAGRRELHKRATRQALQEAATRMFEERGYAETTVRDIADAVGVTERTFFRYFPSKEDLILGEILELFPEFARLVRGRPAEEGPYLAVRNALFHLAAVRGTGVALLFSGLPGQVFSHPARTAQPVLLELEDGLTAALHDRLGDSGGGQDERALSLRASVLARACVAALRATVLAFHALPEEERTLESARGLARQAFDILNDAPRER